jgi:CNT family concentrative nucleoside transporter
MLGIAYALSTSRKNINWRLVVGGILLQFVIAILVLKVGFIRTGFDFISGFFIELMNFTRDGSLFLFGSLIENTDSLGYIFAFQVLPTVVFFSALTSVLYYLNILQYIVYGFAWLMKRTMQLSGAESLAAAANIFVGQTEAPLVVKPYLEKMTRSEILALMTGGMATIAGAVLIAYIGLLGGEDPEQRQFFATHLLVASIISAPAALLISKIMLPESEEVNQELLVPRHSMGSNLLDAITLGTAQGVKLAVNIGAMLLVFIAFIALLNYIILNGVGGPTGLNERVAIWTDGQYEGLTLEYLLGIILAPLAWVIGVPPGDLVAVGQLLGEKIIINEFKAYQAFSVMKTEGTLVDPKSVIIATYALCGFANFSSMGIQIGGISAIAPGQRVTLCRLGLQSLIAGTLACFVTACIAGMLV